MALPRHVWRPRRQAAEHHVGLPAGRGLPRVAERVVRELLRRDLEAEGLAYRSAEAPKIRRPGTC